MEGYDASTYGEGFADVYDDWYASVSDVEATADLVAALAGGGRVLELGVGTGRLALPLVARGLDVWGVDASTAMLDRLKAKPGGDRVQAVRGDFGALDTVDVEGPFAVVLAAYNTFFNLPDEAAQRRCLASVSRLLAEDGSLVVEVFVLDVDPGAPAGVVAPLVVEVDRVVLQVTMRDPERQTVAGQHVTITEAGVRLRPWFVRYATPAQLDAMAAEAGLELERRAAGWRDEPFDDDADRHVSIYRKRYLRDVPPVQGASR